MMSETLWMLAFAFIAGAAAFTVEWCRALLHRIEEHEEEQYRESRSWSYDG